jgi:hypothetical protein
MTARLLTVASLEAIVLFHLLLPRLWSDPLSAIVTATASGRRALRLYLGTVGATGVAGGLALATAPEDRMSLIHAPLMTALPVIALLFLVWQRRAVASIDEERSRRAVSLDLGDEGIPRVAWLAAVPPLLTGGLVYGLARHWGEFPLRDGDLTSVVAWQDPAFKSIVQMLLFGLGWSIWLGIYGLAVWHGMSRQHAFRRSQLSGAVALAWSQTLLWPAWVLPLWLRLPPPGLAFCFAAGAAAVGLLLIAGPRARREWQAADLPPSSYRLYFDRSDPSAFGDRGTNLASPWNWALLAGPAVLFAAPLLIR